MHTNPEMQENNEAADLWERAHNCWLLVHPGGASQNPARNEGIASGVDCCNTLLAHPPTFKYVMDAILHLSAQVQQYCPLLEKWKKQQPHILSIPDVIANPA